MDNSKKDYYIELVKKIAERNTTNRFKGWLYNFHKIIFYEILKTLKKPYKTKARTFWNGEMEIILPENVSITIWRNGFVETDVTIYLIQYLNEGETFIDVGAHFGFYSLLASNLVGNNGQVISFEPTTSTFNQLSNNVSKYGQGNITPYNVAAFNSTEVLEFNDFGIMNSAFNSFFENRGGAKLFGKKLKVNTIILDEFLESNYMDRKISLIKIDAESSEFQVLSGLANTIKKYHPKIILEVGDYSINEVKNSSFLIKLIESFGYHSFELNKTTFQIVPYVIKNNESYKNILLIPD